MLPVGWREVLALATALAATSPSPTEPRCRVGLGRSSLLGVPCELDCLLVWWWWYPLIVPLVVLVALRSSPHQSWIIRREASAVACWPCLLAREDWRSRNVQYVDCELLYAMLRCAGEVCRAKESCLSELNSSFPSRAQYGLGHIVVATTSTCWSWTECHQPTS